MKKKINYNLDGKVVPTGKVGKLKSVSYGGPPETKMSKRQNYWLKHGYTQQQIDNHLEYERYKAKQSRERRKRNNEKNKELIAKIKKEVLHKTFKTKFVDSTVLSISPTVDGTGFYAKIHKKFQDGSEGDFRSYTRFGEYSLKEFIKFY